MVNYLSTREAQCFVQNDIIKIIVHLQFNNLTII